MTRSAPLCLAVDSGATRASWVLFRDPARPLAVGKVEGANYAESGRGGLERLLGSLAAVVGPAASAAGGAPEVIGLAMAGVGRPDIRGPALRDLDAARGPWFARAALYLFHDTESAFWAAHADGRGVVVAAGTGSFAVGADGRGGEARCGGWGRYAGDEGSAYWIAIEALRRILREVDGRSEPSALADRVVRRLGLGAPIELVTWVHVASRTKDEIAALSLDVEAAAEAGDAAARAILAAAGEQLADLAAGVIARLGLGGDGAPVDVVAAGSVLLNSARVRDGLERALRRSYPGVTLRAAELSSDIGTVRLLADRVARDVPPDLPGGRG
jgi:N-acetylglucosamine kinase-like BadF-type ATPase